MIGCSLEDLSLRFGSRQVLENLRLKISPGEFVAIVGSSGSGKSSLLRILAGLQKPSSGQIGFEGDPRRAFVFQDANLLPWRTLEENVSLPLELQGVQNPAIAISALESVHLEDRRNLFPHQLSGGMKMRASLARALSSSPNLLLLDEPFSALDEVTRFDLQERLRALWVQKKWTTLFVTHSLSEAVFLADRILILKDGKIKTEKIVLDIPRTQSSRQSPEFNRQVQELSAEFRQ